MLYYNNYKKTASDQAALPDLCYVKAAVQRKMSDDALSTAGLVATDSASVGTIRLCLFHYLGWDSLRDLPG